MNRGCRALLVLLLFLTMGGTAAGARSLLDRSQPADGEVLNCVPSTVRLWFTEVLEGRVATVRLLDGAGKPVPGAVQTGQGGACLRSPCRRCLPGRTRWSGASSPRTHT